MSILTVIVVFAVKVLDDTDKECSDKDGAQSVLQTIAFLLIAVIVNKVQVKMNEYDYLRLTMDSTWFVSEVEDDDTGDKDGSDNEPLKPNCLAFGQRRHFLFIYKSYLLIAPSLKI